MLTFSRAIRRIGILICFPVIPVLFYENANGQSGQKQAVSLSAQQWNAVEGIFQSAQNKDMNVQFSVRDHQLVAKLLWNNNELHLIPESPLVFSSSHEGNQEPVRIIFKKDSSGLINEVNVADNGIWKRNGHYKPLERKEIEHTPEQLRQFEGLYQLQSEEPRFIQFSVRDNDLLLKQEWDGGERTFVPESPTDFFIKDFPLFTLNFSKDSSGNITQVLAFKRDLWVKTKKPSLTAAQLKSYEGRYRSDDDPDNWIQLFVANDHLMVKQLWDQKEIMLEPRTDIYFYNDAQAYPVIVMKNKEQMVNKVLVLGTNLFTRVN